MTLFSFFFFYIYIYIYLWGPKNGLQHKHRKVWKVVFRKSLSGKQTQLKGKTLSWNLNQIFLWLESVFRWPESVSVDRKVFSVDQLSWWQTNTGKFGKWFPGKWIPGNKHGLIVEHQASFISSSDKRLISSFFHIVFGFLPLK